MTDISEEDLTIKESEAVRKAAQEKLRQAGGVGGANAAYNPYLNPYAANYGMLDLGAGLYDDADLDEDDIDAPPRQLAARERILQQQRARIARQGRERVHAIRARLDAARAETHVARAQVLQARAAAQAATRVAPAPAGRRARTLDNPRRGSLGHGLGGHIAGHGVQTHLAQPQPMYQGLGHPHPHQAPQMGLQDSMIGYMPIYGMQMPGAGLFPHQHAPAPVPRADLATRATPYGNVHAALGDVPPCGYGNQLGVVGGTPVAPQPGGDPGPGPGRVLGARNNGLGDQQGHFDAFF